MTHVCVSTLTIIGSDNGLSPGRRQAIIWSNVGVLLIRTLGTNFSEEICSEIHIFSFRKIHLKMSSGKSRPFVSASLGNGIRMIRRSWDCLLWQFRRWWQRLMTCGAARLIWLSVWRSFVLECMHLTSFLSVYVPICWHHILSIVAFKTIFGLNLILIVVPLF